MRIQGQITRLVTDPETGARRGFGFIRDTEGRSYFFHARALCGSVTRFDHVHEGDVVRFQPREGPKGLLALRVEVQP